MKRQLTLLVPGLLGLSDRPIDRAACQDLDAAGLLSALRKARTRAYPPATLSDALWTLFGLSQQDNKAIAALTRLADVGEAPGIWSRADPVCLRPDRDNIVLIPPADSDLTEDDSRALVQLMNAHFRDDGLVFEAPVAQRWYVRDENYAGVPEPDELAGRHIRHLLAPESDLQRRAAMQMNEIQMLLHNSDINRRRIDQGRMEINSVWFWGGGCLPDRGNSVWCRVWSDHALATGLARHHGIGTEAVPDSSGEWLSTAATGSHLLLLDDCRQALVSGTAARWRGAVETISARWLTPLLAALDQGQLESLVLSPLNGTVYELVGGRSRRYWPWQRRPALTEFMLCQ